MRRLLQSLIALAVLLPLQALSAPGAAPLGVYQGAGCTGVERLGGFTEWFGRKPDFIVDFVAFDSWASFANASDWAIKCWRRGGGGIPVLLSVPMLPKGPYTLAQGAAGEFDGAFRDLATRLVENGYANANIRIGWEFNGGWYPWYAKNDPQSWVAYWRRIVTVMRAVPGASFKFDWCPALGQLGIKPDSVYPGDDVVDVIGMDVYNQTWTKPVPNPEQRWTELMQQSYGLKWQRDFALAHGKPISFPEWGTGHRKDGHGGGDDAYFTRQMAAWIAANNVVYHSYWDYPAPDFNAMLSDGHQPLAGAAFLKAFGSKLPKAPAGLSVGDGR